MRTNVFCKHYRAMSEHETCNAGVEYGKFKGMSYEERPCFGKPGEPARPGCEHVMMPTAEELAKEDEERAKRFQDIGTARQAIVDHLGGPWKRGMKGSGGTIACPVCGEPASLNFSRSGYNGHIHARCATTGCVGWME